jgi:hypothetical protein
MVTQTQTQTESFVLQTKPPAEPTSEEPTILREPEVEEPPQPKWLYPKLLSAGVSFFMAGINDGSLGSLIPYIIRSYAIDTNMVAIL